MWFVTVLKQITNSSHHLPVRYKARPFVISQIKLYRVNLFIRVRRNSNYRRFKSAWVFQGYGVAFQKLVNGLLLPRMYNWKRMLLFILNYHNYPPIHPMFIQSRIAVNGINTMNIQPRASNCFPRCVR
jgi:hypothetical protein